MLKCSEQEIEYKFKDQKIIFKALIHTPTITFEWIQEGNNQISIIFSNGENYRLQADEQQQYFYQVQNEWRDINEKIVALKAKQKNDQQMSQTSPYIVLEIIDLANGLNYQGECTEQYIQGQTLSLEDTGSVFDYLKENIADAFNQDSNVVISYHEGNQEQKVTMKIEQTVKRKKELFILETTLTKQAVDDKVMNTIKEQTLKEQLDDKIESLRQEIQVLREEITNMKANTQKISEPKQIQIQDLQQVQQQVWTSSEVHNTENQVYKLTFQMTEDQLEGEFGILEDGEEQNYGIKSKAYFLTIPDGQLKRGNEQPQQFLPRRFFRNDKVDLIVDLSKKQFIININGQPQAPIQLANSFTGFKYVVRNCEDQSEFIPE